MALDLLNEPEDSDAIEAVGITNEQPAVCGQHCVVSGMPGGTKTLSDSGNESRSMTTDLNAHNAAACDNRLLKPLH